METAGWGAGALRRGDGEPSLALLLGAAASGDVAAFADLYDRVAGQVLGVAISVLRDRAMAEEVVQEVMLAVWRDAERYDPALGSPWTWILMIAHRRAVDVVRSEQSARVRATRWAAATRVRPFDEVAEQVEGALEHGAVRAALATLTPLQREALELAYFGGCTYREVAERLDIPLSTAKTRLRDALQRLGASLAPRGEAALA